MHSLQDALTLLLIALITTGCDTSFRQNFPDTDVVYQANDIDKPAIGFINADGTGNQILSISTYAADPVWSEDGKTILFRMARADFMSFGNWGAPIYIWKGGKGIRSCNILDAGPAYQLPDTDEVVVHLLTSIQIIDIKTCNTVQTLADYREPGQNTKDGIGLSISWDGRYILFSEAKEPPWGSKLLSDYTMKIMDLSTGAVEELGQGINPFMSPDGNWIAYTWLDGVYLIKRDGTEKQKLIDFFNAKERSNGLQRFEKIPPKPRWSPDGKWLIYHKCGPAYPKPACDQLDDYSIFRLNLADGNEEKVIDQGLNPYWR
ncbi:MAG: DPP IV N-terminal domain-containing protein [Omnitrophica WOR_2 bacterium]